MTKSKLVDHTKRAMHAHTNINTWGAVIALLEGGLMYGVESSNVSRVIKIAKAEQQKELARLDAALDALKGTP